MISIKVHQSYRRVVAVCDTEIVGKKFFEGKKQLDVRENFYNGTEFTEEEAVKQLQRHYVEDATFNIVGKNAVKAAMEAQIIDKNSTASVAGVPFALKLI
jgi:uncharacterized protein